MKLRRHSPDPVEINLTPLIDVVFLLLIFFMVSTTFDRQAELSIELPQARADATPPAVEPIDVSIDAQGRFFVGGQLLGNAQLATLKQAMSDAGVGQETPSVVIHADANTPHRAVVTVMDAARQLGWVKLRFTASAAKPTN